jgi:hypothetical protein
VSSVVYNGVCLPYARIMNFAQDAVYDEVSQTDWYCTKFDVRVEAVINCEYASLICPDVNFASRPNAAELMNIVRSRLLKPRKQLSVRFNGVELIPRSDQNPGINNRGSVDAQNGPKPQSCPCVQLNNETFMMHWHVIAHYWEKNTDPDGNANPVTRNQMGNPVLFNRWSETVEIDNKNYTRKSREGKFAIRSDNGDGHTADRFRSQFALLGVERGFLRDSSSYTISPDGLAIQYRVSDKEVFKKPPRPAFTARGSYTERVNRAGALRHGDCNVTLEGAKDTPQEDLVVTAVFVCSKKLVLQGGINILESASVTVDLYENVVSCNMSVMYRPGQLRLFGVAGLKLSNPEMIFTPGTDHQADYTPPYKDRGTASVLLQAAAYYDPNLVGNRLGAGNTETRQNDLTEAAPFKVQHVQGLQAGEAGRRQE